MSRIVSAVTIFNELQKNSPELVETLFKGFYNDLRDEGKNGMGVTPDRIPVYAYEQEHLSVSFNSKTITLAAERQKRPLPALEQRALDAMLATASRPDLVHEMTMRSGDLQLLNNYTILHSRTAWSDPENIEERRCMLRVWLKAAEPRPIPAGFAGGYLTGVKYDVGQQAEALRAS